MGDEVLHDADDDVLPFGADMGDACGPMADFMLDAEMLHDDGRPVLLHARQGVDDEFQLRDGIAVIAVVGGVQENGAGLFPGHVIVTVVACRAKSYLEIFALVDRDVEGLAELRACEAVKRMVVVADGAQDGQFAF